MSKFHRVELSAIYLKRQAAMAGARTQASQGGAGIFILLGVQPNVSWNDHSALVEVGRQPEDREVAAVYHAVAV